MAGLESNGQRVVRSVAGDATQLHTAGDPFIGLI